jgi:hypothetical protein
MKCLKADCWNDAAFQSNYCCEEHDPIIIIQKTLRSIDDTLINIKERLNKLEKELFETKQRHDYEDMLSEERAERA